MIKKIYWIISLVLSCLYISGLCSEQDISKPQEKRTIPMAPSQVSFTLRNTYLSLDGIKWEGVEGREAIMKKLYQMSGEIIPTDLRPYISQECEVSKIENSILQNAKTVAWLPEEDFMALLKEFPEYLISIDVTSFVATPEQLEDLAKYCDVLLSSPQVVELGQCESFYPFHHEVVTLGEEPFKGKWGKFYLATMESCRKYNKRMLTADPPGFPKMHLGVFLEKGGADIIRKYDDLFFPATKNNAFFTGHYNLCESLVQGCWLAGMFRERSSSAESWLWTNLGLRELGVDKGAGRENGRYEDCPYSQYSIQWAKDALAGATHFRQESVHLTQAVLHSLEAKGIVQLDPKIWDWKVTGEPWKSPLHWETLPDLFKLARFIINNPVIPTRDEVRQSTKVVLKYTGFKDDEKIKQVIDILYGKKKFGDYLCPNTRYGIIAVIPAPEKFTWVANWGAKVLDPSVLNPEEILKEYEKAYSESTSSAYVLKSPHSIFITSPDENTTTPFVAKEKLGKWQIETVVSKDRMLLLADKGNELSFYTHGRAGDISEMVITTSSDAVVKLEGVSLTENGLNRIEKLSEKRLKVIINHTNHAVEGGIFVK